MSGGHWNYEGSQTRDHLEEVGHDPMVQRRWPRLGQVIANLSQSLYEIEHDMDWDLSGDSFVRCDDTFEKDALSKLKAALEE